MVFSWFIHPFLSFLGFLLDCEKNRFNIWFDFVVLFVLTRKHSKVLFLYEADKGYLWILTLGCALAYPNKMNHDCCHRFNFTQVKIKKPKTKKKFWHDARLKLSKCIRNCICSKNVIKYFECLRALRATVYVDKKIHRSCQLTAI